MKKFLSAILSAIMVFALVSAAAADGSAADLSTWQPVALNSIGMHLLIPGDMTEGEPDSSKLEAYTASNDSMTFVISVYSAELVSAEEMISGLEGAGCSVVPNALQDFGFKYDHLFITNDAEPLHASVILLGSDNCYYEFECYGNDDSALETFGMILGSLTDTSAATAAAPDFSAWQSVPLNDIGMYLLIPGDMTEGEPDTANLQAYIASNDSLSFVINVVSADLVTEDELVAVYEENGCTVIPNALQNFGFKFDHLFIANEAEPLYASVILLGSDNCYYEFECYGNDDSALETFGMILGSLAPVPTEQAA